MGYSFMAEGQDMPENCCGWRRILELPYRIFERLFMPTAVMAEALMMGGRHAFYAILDTGCTHSCAGVDWVTSYLTEYRTVTGREPLFQRYRWKIRFKFDNATTETSEWTYTIPVILTSGCEGWLEVATLRGAQQPLLSRVSQARLGLVIDVEEKTAFSKTLNENIPLEQNAVGHFMLKLLTDAPATDTNPIAQTLATEDEPTDLPLLCSSDSDGPPPLAGDTSAKSLQSERIRKLKDKLNANTETSSSSSSSSADAWGSKKADRPPIGTFGKAI